VLAMAISSITVVFNSLILYRAKIDYGPLVQRSIKIE